MRTPFFLGASVVVTMALCETFDNKSVACLIARLKVTKQEIAKRGERELESFVLSGIWKGGYREGDPTSVKGSSSYHYPVFYKGEMVSPLYACYAECLLGYINDSINVLEIGPGGGCWTKTILQLNPKSITCVDALPAEYNKFWEYVGLSEKLNYQQIKDFSLDCVSDNSIDFVFSFGTFCHISPLLINEYFENMYKKLRSGAEGFIMYADYDKYNKFQETHGHQERRESKQDESTLMQRTIIPCWYHMGINRMKITLEELGYEVLNADIDVVDRDPIVHFRKK